MAEIDTTQLLTQMRQLAAQADAMASQPEPVDSGFAELLQASVEKVNETQASAAELAESFERGDADVGLPEVMIALQTASLSFQAMTEVRNRLVTAYQEIMNMPI